MIVKELSKKLGVATKDLIKPLKELASDAKKAGDKLTGKEVKYLTSLFKSGGAKKAAEKAPAKKKTVKKEKAPEKTANKAKPQKAKAPKKEKTVIKKKAVKKKTPLKKEPKPKKKVVKEKIVKEKADARKAVVKEKKKKPPVAEKIVPPREETPIKKPEPAKPKIPDVVPAEEPEKKQEAVPSVSARITVKINEATTTGQLADKMKVKVGDVIKALIGQNVLVTINQRLDKATAELAADAFNCNVEYVDLYGEEFEEKEEEKEDKSKLKSRAPVVTIMGHIDHGKTSILDVIRRSKITDRESGGITQHIGAYHVKLEKGMITFLDTPGHEAFTAMRARGAKVTDIVVLVVAADDGVMPQTEEAIDHAKAAGVPIIVAINKVDLPNADVEKVKQGLSAKGMVAEDWGGKTIMVEVSAKQNKGIDQLLEMILLESEMQEMRANPDKKASGIVIEAETSKQKGNVATVLVRSGTLNVRDPFVCGFTSGKVRAMHDDWGRRIESVGPSMVAEVLGFNDCPRVGDKFFTVDNIQAAKEIGKTRESHRRQDEMVGSRKVTLEDLHRQIEEGAIKQFNVVVKSDVRGSVEALCDSLEKITTKEIKLKIIRKDIGAINENDVNLAAASNALIIGMHVRPAMGAQFLAEKQGVEIRSYNVIYEIIDEIKKALEGMLDPEVKEKFLGRCNVKEIFRTTKTRLIIGSHVFEGKIVNNAKVRILRENVIVAEGKINSLRRFKDDVKEVSQGMECGLSFENLSNIRVGDEIECYTVETVKKKLVIED